MNAYIVYYLDHHIRGHTYEGRVRCTVGGMCYDASDCVHWSGPHKSRSAMAKNSVFCGIIGRVLHLLQ